MINQSNIKDIDQNKIIDQIRCLGIDMIHEANSGHPGIVLGAAPIIYALYAHHLNFDPENPKFFNRDRFIMSAGHGSALLYATLYMAGFDISLDDLKDFRKIDSKTPGHPEYGVTPGVDCTTGPLGQGFATAVGMAIAEANLRARYKVIDHYTYVLCGDGDLMEGISYEASSLAGTLKLNRLIVLYDSNKICLDSSIDKTFNDNIKQRFESLGWNYIVVEDGSSYENISKAIKEAKGCIDKPTLIEVKTIIGKYSKNEGTSKVHGSPLDVDDISSIKEKMGVRDIPFQVSQQASDDFKTIINSRCSNLVEEFNNKLVKIPATDKTEIDGFIDEDPQIDFKNYVYETPEDMIEAPRDTSRKILNYVVQNSPYMMGGAADTFGPNKTYVDEIGDFSKDNYSGRNIFYGVREHAMGAITNGLNLHGYRPYCSTFLSFSDYLKPSLRLACLMHLPNIYIFSHDSISVGEDGPTHQPVEQLSELRCLPHFEVFRPADANEVIGSYRAILDRTNNPAAIVLSRNKLPILDCTNATDVEKGGYVVHEADRKPDAIVVSCGEELHMVLDTIKPLKEKGIEINVVSMPNINRFLNQDDEYIDSVLPVGIKKIAVEAAASLPWKQIIYNSKNLITLDQFGTSGNYKDVYKKYGFDTESLINKIEELIK